MNVQFYQEILLWFNTLNNTHITLSVDQIFLQNYPPPAIDDVLRRRLDLLILLIKKYIYFFFFFFFIRVFNYLQHNNTTMYLKNKVN